SWGSHAVKANEVRQLRRSARAELLHGRPVGGFRKYPAGHQSGCDVVCHSLLLDEIRGTWAGDDGGELIVGQAFSFRQADMFMKLVRRPEMRVRHLSRSPEPRPTVKDWIPSP